MRYIIDRDNEIELIVSRSSEISYPLHNHISVDTVGLVTEGCIKLNIDGEENYFEQGESFSVPAYIPHSLECIRTYSLLVLCVKSSQNRFVEMGVQKLKELIEKFPEQRLSIDEMAERTYISKFQMIRNFKKEVGLTPHRFQIQNRVRKAQRLLQRQMDLTKVAYDTGFYDQSHFIKSFEKIVGLTPANYASAFCRKAISNRKIQTIGEARAFLIQSRDKFSEEI